jgi:hypothetical protein
MARLTNLVFLLAIGGLTGPLAAYDGADLSRPHWTDMQELEAYRDELYGFHRRCQESATQHVLEIDDAILCARVFLALKLSFLDGSSLARYEGLSAPTRAMANEKGYAAYLAWLHRSLALAEPEGR